MEMQKLFSAFGAVVLVRILSLQMSESPPSHKARLSSPVASDVSVDSTEANRLTTSASVIFEEKTSAEMCTARLNGYRAADWAMPLKLRIIGSVTRETYGHFCLPARQSPSLVMSRNNSGQDPLSESEVLNNILNRRVLGSANCPQGVYMKSNEPSYPNITGEFNGCVNHTSTSIHPRAIIRNKGVDGISLNNSTYGQGSSLEIMDLLDNATNIVTVPSSNVISDRISSRDTSILNVLDARRLAEPDNTKADFLLRGMGSNHTSPWSIPVSRTVLPIADTNRRSAEVVHQNFSSPCTKNLHIKSPLVFSPVLSNAASQKGCQANIWLKLENVQPTGSFKIRGMEQVCKKWVAAGVNHIVCPSGGNAGLAAAHAAQAYGLACTIVMPESEEVMARRRFALECPNAKVISHGSEWLGAFHRAEQLISDLTSHPSEASIRLLHPYDQPELWEGYESIVDELSPEMGQPDVMVVAVGGGGLLAGIIQGLWNRGWSSTHVVAVEVEGVDSLYRSLRSGQLESTPHAVTVATSLVAPVLARRAFNLAQCHSLTPVTCSEVEAMDATKNFLDDHGMLVEPACGAALSVAYSGVINRLQADGRIPRPANVVIVIGGGRNVSARMITEWQHTESKFANTHSCGSFAPVSITNAFMPQLSPHTLCSDLAQKTTAYNQQTELTTDLDSTLKLNGSSSSSTPRTLCSILGRTTGSLMLLDNMDRQINNDCAVDNGPTLNPHDLVNFSKLLAPSDGDGEESSLKD